MRLSIRTIAFAVFWFLTGILVADQFGVTKLNPYILGSIGIVAGLIVIVAPSASPRGSQEQALKNG